MKLLTDFVALNRYGFSAGEFALLTVLLAHADDSGMVPFSQHAIPIKMSLRTVKRHLGTLKRAGIVTARPKLRVRPQSHWDKPSRLPHHRRNPGREYRGNAYGEWRNPEEHPNILAYLARRNPSYEASIAYLRTRDRSNNHAALHWWSKLEAKAHLINAVLRRGNRYIEQVEQDALFAKGKLYYYLKSFNLRFRSRPEQKTFIVDYHGDLVEGRIVQRYKNATALIEIAHHSVFERHYARWSASSWAYRLYRPAQRIERRIPLHKAARHCRLSPRGMRRVLRLLRIAEGQGVPIALVERLTGQSWELLQIEDEHHDPA